MPIKKNSITGEIQYTAPNRADLFSQTGVANNGNFAICDKTDYIKQIKFDPALSGTNSTVTLATSPGTTGDVTIYLPSTSGTIAYSSFPANPLPYQVVASDSSSNPVWMDLSNPSVMLQWCEDWDGASQNGATNWANNSSGGGGASLGHALDSGHPGTLKLVSGGGSTGWGILYRDFNYVFGAGQVDFEVLFQTAQVSDGTNTFSVVLGFTNDISGFAGSAGIFFTYTHSLNSGNWVGKTISGSSTTSVNTSVPFSNSLNTWTKLGIRISADASLVTFYINGVSVGTSSTNIPGDLTNRVGVIFAHLQSVTDGTNCVDYIDYAKYKQIFTTPR